jgi:uncharacterized membrane protein YgcG
MEERTPKTSAIFAAEVQKRSDTLDRCLQAIAQKQATIDSCARQYPEFKELSTLLYAAQAVQNVRPESLSQMSKNQMRQRVLERYRARKPRRTVQNTIRQAPWFRPVAALCAIILIIFLSGMGLVKASAATLPGDSLYPIKRAAEAVQVAVSSGDALTNLLQDQAEVRLSEVSTLAEQNRPIPLWVVGDTSTAVSTAMEAQPDPMKRQQLYADAQQAIQKAQMAQVINSDIAQTTLASIAASAANGGRDPRVTAPSQSPTILPSLGRTKATENATDSATEVRTEKSTDTPTVEATNSATPDFTETEEPRETATLLPTTTPTDTELIEKPDPTRPKPGMGSRPTKVVPQPNGNANGNSSVNPNGNPNAKATPNSNPNGNGNGGGNAGGNGNGNGGGNAGGSGNGNGGGKSK